MYTAGKLRVVKAGIFCIFLTCWQGTFAQLTISTSGQTTSPGTNWSISSGVLTVTGTANVHPSVITNALASNNVTVNVPFGSAFDIAINNNIAYAGGTARSLSFNSSNNITIASGVSISSSAAALSVVLRAANATAGSDNGRVVMDGVTINTNGGHFRDGGGPGTTTWNGLTVGNGAARTYANGESGISFAGSSLTTNGGNV